MFKLEYILKIFKYKLLILNFSNYSNEKYSKFTSNFLDDQDFSNFMRGVDKGGLDKGGLDKGGLDKGGTGQRGDWTKGFTVFIRIIYKLLKR